MTKGSILINVGLIISGFVFAIVKDYTFEHVSTNSFYTIGGALLAAAVTFVLYGLILTKLGK